MRLKSARGRFISRHRDTKNTLEASGEDVKNTLETSGEDVKNTLETSGEDVKNTLETSVEDVVNKEVNGQPVTWYILQHLRISTKSRFPAPVSSVVLEFYTRFECSFGVLHSFRV